MSDPLPWVSRFAERPEYSPGGHSGVINRSLVGLDVRESDRLSIWVGTMSPGGDADPHIHHNSDQIYLVVSGRVKVTNEQEHTELGPLETAYIVAGNHHAIANVGDEVAQVLVISAPGLPGNAKGKEGGNGWTS